MTALQRDCPCGSGQTYDACCGRFHRGTDRAETPEQLMRSRYAAYAVGGAVGDAYVFRTWHPRTRPSDVTASPGLVWTGLEILAVVDGGPDDDTGQVEFRAHFRSGGRGGDMHEHSRFERRAGRWVYVDGDVRPDAP